MAPSFANLLFLPFADKLKGKSEGKKVESALILEGVMLIYEKTHPIMVRDKLNAFLESKDRIQDEE
jgi:chemotaxis protein MotA